jgi:CXXC-20-CXXC protein
MHPYGTLSERVMTKSEEWINMQKCQKCENQFTWKSIEKSLALGYRPITCSKCQSVHYVSFWTRLILAGSITMIPLGLMFMIIIPFRIIPLSVEFWIAFYLIWAAVIIGITPFFAKYRIRETCEDVSDETRIQG